MTRNSTLLLKIVLVFIAMGAVASMIGFPPTEGRAANLDLISIYTDPFILYLYIASIPFFVGLHQANALLTFVDKRKTFSQGAVNSLKNIKFASVSLIGFIALALVYIRFFVHGEDSAGPSMLGFLASLVIAVVGVTAGVLQNQLQKVVDVKSKK